eukprot:905314-Rhodomonas_salina.1
MEQTPSKNGTELLRKRSKLHFATPAPPSSTDPSCLQQTLDTVAAPTCLSAFSSPEFPSVFWSEIAEHLDSDLHVNWRQCRMFVCDVEATTCLYIPHPIPSLSIDSILISLPSLGRELLPLLMIRLVGGSGTAAVCCHHQSAKALLSACQTDWFDDASAPFSTICYLHKLLPVLPGPEPTPGGPAA